MPVDVADPQAHRRPLPAPGEDLALGLGERLQVVGVDGLGAEGVPADAVGDRVAGDALHRRAHGADPALGVRMLMTSGEASTTAWRVASRSRTAASAWRRSVTSMT